MDPRRLRSNSDTDFFFEKNLLERQKAKVSKIFLSLDENQKIFRRTSLIRSLKIITDHQKSLLFLNQHLTTNLHLLQKIKVVLLTN